MLKAEHQIFPKSFNFPCDALFKIFPPESAHTDKQKVAMAGNHDDFLAAYSPEFTVQGRDYRPYCENI
jgi:hypothetical protein